MSSAADHKPKSSGARQCIEATCDVRLSDKFPLDAVSNVSEGLGLLSGEADLVFAHLSAVLNELIGCR